jgi:hypothetical protein
METQKLKMSDIAAAAKAKTLELDIPASLFLVTSGMEDAGCQFACSSIIPETDADMAKRWIVNACLGLINGCFSGDPKAWSALAYWHMVQQANEEKAKCDEEFKRLMAELNAKMKKGEQE